MKKAAVIFTCAVILMATVSCIGIHDGGEAQGTSPTLGQELIDLKKAKDEGAITYEEYKALKVKVVEFYE
jgi:hypothetical protein